ncbi:MAG: hypothetical protein M0Z31_12465 [Clostridia bacterium]|nr:hypothetical protein [Clostridia bacterium]
MYHSIYNNIFWGFMLVLLDFRIQFFDVVPDFIGYIMIFNGLGKLRGQHNFFGKARTPAFMLIFLSLMDLVQLPGNNLLENSITTQNIWFILLGQVYVIIDLWMAYWICKAVYTLAGEHDLRDIAQRAKYRWYYFLYTSGAGLAFTPFLYNTSRAFLLTWLGLLIPMVITKFLIAFLVKGAGKELGGRGEDKLITDLDE